MKRVAILISGSGSNMAALIAAMTGDFPARPVLVVANRADAGGLTKAQAAGVPTKVVAHRDFASRAEFEAALDMVLKVVQPDIICLAGFMRILSPEFVAQWSGRILNIHPSLLPKYPGLHTHDRALAAGDKTAGCTVHLVTGELDAGPVLGQAEVPVLPGDTAETLAARVLAEEHPLYVSTLREFAARDL